MDNCGKNVVDAATIANVEKQPQALLLPLHSFFIVLESRIN